MLLVVDGLHLGKWSAPKLRKQFRFKFPFKWKTLNSSTTIDKSVPPTKTNGSASVPIDPEAFMTTVIAFVNLKICYSVLSESPL